MSAASIAVMASASIRVPNGSPTRWHHFSVMYRSDNGSTSASAHAAAKIVPMGITTAATRRAAATGGMKERPSVSFRKTILRYAPVRAMSHALSVKRI